MVDLGSCSDFDYVSEIEHKHRKPLYMIRTLWNIPTYQFDVYRYESLCSHSLTFGIVILVFLVMAETFSKRMFMLVPKLDQEAPYYLLARMLLGAKPAPWHRVSIAK